MDTQLEKLEKIERRLEYIEKLESFHPAIVQEANAKCAQYAGGFVDSGQLKYHWCLYEATLQELAQCILDCMTIIAKQKKYESNIIGVLEP